MTSRKPAKPPGKEKKGLRNAPHLLRVEDPPEHFAPLFAAAQAEDLRIGWLDLPSETPAPVPAPLETAATLGALRAVAVGEGRSVAVKPMKGAPVLRDLLREHFRGCVLVLIRGDVPGNDAAHLQPAGDTWTVTAAGEPARPFTSAALAAALRQPRPWGPPLPPPPPKPPKPEKKGKKRRDQRVKKAKEKKRPAGDS